MEASFEGILAQLRGEEVNAVAETSAATTTEASIDVDPISSDKPLSLSLTNVAVTNDMAQIFGEALLGSDFAVSDIKLQLFWMSAHPNAYHAFLQYLRTSDSLRTVSLYGNPTGVPGCRDTAEQILQAVAENECIKELNLAWIELSAASIQIQRSIKELILIRSAFKEDDDEEEEVFIPQVPSNLRTLIIDVWDQDSMKTLAQIGSYHSSVGTLYVRYPLPFVEEQPVIDFISSQTSLKEVLVRNCGTDLSHMANIVESLPEATTSVEVINGYWDSPEMRQLAHTPNDAVFKSHKKSMIADMFKTNSLIMLHCYVTTAASKRESIFTEAEQQQIKDTGSRNYMLPVLMQVGNSLWDDTSNWPALLSLGVSSEHRIHCSLLYELVRDQLMQRPARTRPRISRDTPAVEDHERTSLAPYRRFVAWIKRRRQRRRMS